jgi:diguanylate cyclase (GGDEF)-like protein/PAS domain S-box-containing protein
MRESAPSTPRRQISQAIDGLTGLGKRLIEPKADVPEAFRRSTRLLLSLLVVLLTVGGLAIVLILLPTDFAANPALSLFMAVVGEAMLLVAYSLGRAGRHQWAGALTVAILLVSVYVTLILLADLERMAPFLVLCLVLSSLFLPFSATAVTLAVTLAGLLVVPWFLPAVSSGPVILQAFLLSSVGGLLLMAAFIRERDIQQIEAQSLALSQSEERFRAVVQSADQAILTLDGQGRILSWNRGAQVIFQYSEAEAVGQLVSALIDASSFHPEPQAWQAVLQASATQADLGQPNRQGRRKDGSVFPLESSLITTRVKDEALYTAFMRDVTERQRQLEDLQRWAGELELHNQELALLTEMEDILLACADRAEAHAVIGRFAARLFPQASGALYVFHASRNLLEAVVRWGDAPPSERTFEPGECWALRRGRTHQVLNPETEVICSHRAASPADSSLCLPLTAQSEILGVLHIRQTISGKRDAKPRSRLVDERQLALAHSVAEGLAMALASLALRETLQSQAIRDPLTGLANRRFLAETLERELARAQRQARPLGVVLLDLDHFKQFNDTFGHSAGDAVLREVAAFLKHSIRGSDLASRYGGEEFVVILPEASVADTAQRAEQLRDGITRLAVQHQGQLLGLLTASVGVAVHPAHGATGEALLQAADAALYQAKARGRNQVAVAAADTG